LYVEDDPINIVFGKSLFSKIGHDITVAENGIECLEKMGSSAEFVGRFQDMKA